MRKKGDCTEFADLFIALCRINEIPARFTEGFTVSGSPQAHDWVEAHTDAYGWVPFDPTFGATDNATLFRNLTNNYVYVSSVRNDYVLNRYHYWASWYSGGKATIDYEYDVSAVK